MILLLGSTSSHTRPVSYSKSLNWSGIFLNLLSADPFMCSAFNFSGIGMFLSFGKISDGMTFD